jgi:hypothetical protein
MHQALQTHFPTPFHVFPTTFRYGEPAHQERERHVNQYYVRAPLVQGQAMGDFELTRLTTAWTQGKPPPSPYSIPCTSPRGLHPNGFLS